MVNRGNHGGYHGINGGYLHGNGNECCWLYGHCKPYLDGERFANPNNNRHDRYLCRSFKYIYSHWRWHLCLVDRRDHCGYHGEHGRYLHGDGDKRFRLYCHGEPHLDR